MLGTLPYMAPEQVEGHETDARTDIFALGVVRLRDGDASAALSRKQPCQPGRSNPHPRATAGFVADCRSRRSTLDRIVSKCLTKNPDERWQSAHDLAAELRWIAEGDTSGPLAVGPAPRPRRCSRMALALPAAGRRG